ncbi:MAG: hypothetical protein ABIY50_04880 [Ignavibacteria bacterium]
MSKFSYVKYILIIYFVTIAAGYTEAAVKFYQTSKLNNDGTTTLTFTYSASESEVKSNNNMIGSLPFTVEKVREYFAFPNGDIKKALVYKDQNDASLMTATVDIIVKDFTKISSSKALSGLKIGYGKSDTGVVYSWLVPTSFMQDNKIDTYQFLTSAEGEIKSTNGLFKDNFCRWFVYKDKMDPAGAYFVTTFIPGKSTTTNTTTTTETGKTNTEKPEGSGGKSCGIFGMELPLILLLGFAFSNYKSKRKS